MVQWRAVGMGGLACLIGAGCHRDSTQQGAAAASEGCPPEWLVPPPVESAIAVPTGGGRAVLHGAATGTQNYACARTAADGGASFAWVPAGPEARLADCRGTVLGRHFASDGGASEPEWQLADGTYVIAHKVAASTPPGSAGSAPWLLLAADGRGGDAPLGKSRYVERVNTHGGAAPSTPCEEARFGQIEKVAYTADYYFFAP